MAATGKTRTGGFAVGFRQGWTNWFKDVKALGTWASQNGFQHVDLGGGTPDDVGFLSAGGAGIGTVDLLDFTKLMATDAGARKDLVARNVEHIKAFSAKGAKVFFTCLLPGDPAAKRSDNYKIAVEVYKPLAAAADAAGAKIAIEGYPGGAPHYGGICCTPETCRAFVKDVGAKSIGWNYDPSHLIRLGVDHVRFLNEFVDRVWHVHAKDTELMPEAQYELGLYQGSAFKNGRGFGDHIWRYTIPGHGVARWTEIFNILKTANFAGKVSIELEDENFNGTDDGEKKGLLHSLAFLQGA